MISSHLKNVILKQHQIFHSRIESFSCFFLLYHKLKMEIKKEYNIIRGEENTVWFCGKNYTTLKTT